MLKTSREGTSGGWDCGVGARVATHSRSARRDPSQHHLFTASSSACAAACPRPRSSRASAVPVTANHPQPPLVFLLTIDGASAGPPQAAVARPPVLIPPLKRNSTPLHTPRRERQPHADGQPAGHQVWCTPSTQSLGSGRRWSAPPTHSLPSPPPLRRPPPSRCASGHGMPLLPGGGRRFATCPAAAAGDCAARWRRRGGVSCCALNSDTPLP